MGFVTKEKLFSKDFFITYGWLLGGCFMFALGAVLFAEPYGFAPGGTYGLSMVFHHLWGWETEIAALCMDVLIPNNNKGTSILRSLPFVWMCLCCCWEFIS